MLLGLCTVTVNAVKTFAVNMPLVEGHVNVLLRSFDASGDLPRGLSIQFF
jgi:hypothetical protein